MKLYNIRTPDFRFKDARGCLVQLVHEGFPQINVLESAAGSSRGAHFHKRAVEAFYVVNGSVEVTLLNKELTEHVLFRQGDFFEIPPWVLHNMHFPEACLMVQLYSIPVENKDGTKDIFTEAEFNA